jgi:DnaK suppressor protein
MAVASKTRNNKYAPYARLLHAKRAELHGHLRDHRQEVLAERIPEDNWGLASRELMQDLAVGTLEREAQMLEEVEHALVRLTNGVYGLCEGCGEPIPERRLRALPWARQCVPCAERSQGTWKN